VVLLLLLTDLQEMLILEVAAVVVCPRAVKRVAVVPERQVS
jgi:hypothetical protein